MVKPMAQDEKPAAAAKSRDWWDKSDVIVKGLAAILLPAAIAFYGYYSEEKRAHESEQNRMEQASQAEANRRAQVVIQTLSSRQATVADLKAKMFATLMQNYFKGGQSRPKILELMALNFQDDFELRPLFDNLDAEFKDQASKTELRRVAKNIVSREIANLVGSGGSVCDLDLSQTGSGKLGCNGMDGHESCQDGLAMAQPGGVTCVPIVLRLLKVQEDRIQVATSAEDRDGFEVSYFDMPFTDHSSKGGLTYSVVLASTDAKLGKARIKLVLFPQNYFSGTNKLKLDQRIGELLDQDFSKSAP
jgi:hypothetical protein